MADEKWILVASQRNFSQRGAGKGNTSRLTKVNPPNLEIVEKN
jgi:hypothetical protein